MRKSVILAAFLGAMTAAVPVMARDSARDSGTSLAAASVAPESIAVVSAYVGGVMVVESIRAVGEVIEIVLTGAGTASRAVLTLMADSVKAVGLAAGQTVKVVAEGAGYLVVAAGKALCFLPGEAEQSLVHSTRSH